MCGISGIYNSDGRPADADTVRRMCGALAHRGPNAEGFFVAGPTALGVRRLSVVDVAGGTQPMQTPDGQITLAFNGEIYNHNELRAELIARNHTFRSRSDTETLLRAYVEFGVECLSRLNGMFAFAIWDARQQILLLARDRIGIKPLYFYRSGGQVRFASEIKALLADPAIPRSLNHAALGYFLRYGFVGTEETLFNGIIKFPPGHYALLGKSGMTMRPYPQPPLEIRSDDARSVADRLQTAVGNSVRRQGNTEGPLGIFLSGGMDSSSLVHFMSAGSTTQVRTYAVGYAERDAFYDERSHARAVARHYGTIHEEVVMSPRHGLLIPKLVSDMDEPSSDSAFLVTHVIAAQASRSVNVVLSGLGGDELFGGYLRYLSPALTAAYRKLPLILRRGLQSLARHLPADRRSALLNYIRLGRGFLRSTDLPTFDQYDRTTEILSKEVLAALAPGITRHVNDAAAIRRTLFDAGTPSDILAQLIRFDLQTSLIDKLLMLTDRMTMAVGIEARVPLLDSEVLTIAAQIPSSLKIRGFSLRHIQKQSMQGLLPPGVQRRRKRGFGCPIGSWFRHELREMLCDVLSPAAVRRTGVFDAEVTQRLIADHLQRKEDHSEALLALLTFELWHLQWFG